MSISKKIVAVALCLVMLTCALASCNSRTKKNRGAGTEGLDYYPLPNETYGVMAGTALYLETVTVPEEYEGSEVTEILPSAFAGATYLESIVIPKSITRIYGSAFMGCPELDAIYFCGTQEDWKAISINEGRDNLKSITVYYFSGEKPSQSGNYWHYVDGVPTPWAKSLGTQSL